MLVPSSSASGWDGRTSVLVDIDLPPYVKSRVVQALLEPSDIAVFVRDGKPVVGTERWWSGHTILDNCGAVVDCAERLATERIISGTTAPFTAFYLSTFLYRELEDRVERLIRVGPSLGFCLIWSTWTHNDEGPHLEGYPVIRYGP